MAMELSTLAQRGTRQVTMDVKLYQSVLKFFAGLSFAKLPAILLSRTAYLVLDSAVACAAIWRANQSRPAIVLGAMFVICGVALRYFAIAVRWDRTMPAIEGVYRFVRAPYLSGSAMMWCGMALAARDLSLLMTVICVVGALASLGLLRYERASLSAEQFDRLLYVRDVPLLMPQILGFRAVKPLVSEIATAGGSSMRVLGREWPGVVIGFGTLLCLLFGLRYLSLHTQLASTASVVIIAILAYRIYLDWNGSEPESGSVGRIRI
jgi:hypothetical protein